MAENGQKMVEVIKKMFFLSNFFTKESFKDFLDRNSGPDLVFKTKSVEL